MLLQACIARYAYERDESEQRAMRALRLQLLGSAGALRMRRDVCAATLAILEAL